MSQFSETIGSFTRTGNYPLEANYIFPDEASLKEFYSEDNTTLHKGLLKIVEKDETGKQALYWVDENLQFVKLISTNNIQEILDKIAEFEEVKTATDTLSSNLQKVVGTEDEISAYLETLSYPSLTALSKALNEVINVENADGLINTISEFKKFLEGYSEDDKLKDIIDSLIGDPIPSPDFRTLRKIEDFVRKLKSKSEHSDDNLQSELDTIQIGVGLSADGSFSADSETIFLKEATSVMNALCILDGLVSQALERTGYEVDNTDPDKVVELTKETSEEVNKLSADVRISTDKTNILEKDGNALLVRGTADNILVGENTLKEVLDLNAANDRRHQNRLAELAALINNEHTIIQVDALPANPESENFIYLLPDNDLYRWKNGEWNRLFKGTLDTIDGELDTLKGQLNLLNSSVVKTIEVGTVNKGVTAAVTASTTNNKTTLNFTLPKGDTGAKGDKGDDGLSPLTYVSSDNVTVNYVSSMKTFDITKFNRTPVVDDTFVCIIWDSLDTGWLNLRKVTGVNGQNVETLSLNAAQIRGPKGDTGAQGPAGENATTTEIATESTNGLMSSVDKQKTNKFNLHQYWMTTNEKLGINCVPGEEDTPESSFQFAVNGSTYFFGGTTSLVSGVKVGNGLSADYISTGNYRVQSDETVDYYMQIGDENNNEDAVASFQVHRVRTADEDPDSDNFIGSPMYLAVDTEGNDYVKAIDLRYESMTSLSDIREKNIQRDVELSVEYIANSPSFVFTYKKDPSGKLHVGTSANYWYNIFPEVVTTANQRYNLDYVALNNASTIALAKEVVNQKAEIASLKSEIESLKQLILNK